MDVVDYGEKALITGASSGIGAVYAEKLAQRGFDLVLVARDQSRLSHIAAEIESKYGVQVTFISADLSKQEDVASIGKLLRDDSSITMLLNNAGMASSDPLASSKPHAYRCDDRSQCMGGDALSERCGGGFC